MNSQPPPLQSGIDYSPPPPKQGGTSKTWVIGCSAGCLLALLLFGVAAFFVVRGLLTAWEEAREKLTSDTPARFETPVAGESEIREVTERFDRFRDALVSGNDAPPLVLTGEEANWLICFHPDLADLKDHTRVSIEGERLTSEVSLPLDGLMPSMKGRYLNGEATIRLSLANGKINAYIEDLQAEGFSVPEAIMRQLRKENIFEGSETDPEFDSLINNLEEIRIEDGKLRVVPKPASQRPER